MENLLNDMLNPQKQNEAFKTLYINIKSQQGINELNTHLKNNNRIAYLFLKEVVTRAINENDHIILKLIVQDIQKYTNLLYTTDANNTIQLLVFFENLSQNCLLDFAFFSYLQGQIIKHESNLIFLCKVIKLLDATTKKYTTMRRSNTLYAEINQNVSLFGNIIFSLFQKHVLLELILDILYNFIFQDIPTFFEEKSNELNNLLINLLPNNNINIFNATCNVLSLFVLKYPECADTGIIMNSLCNLMSLKRNNEITASEKHLFCSIVRRKEVAVLANNINQIIPILYKMCYFNFDSDFDHDSLDYLRKTQTIEKDYFRSNEADSITIIDKLFNPDYSIFNFNQDEAFIFFCTVIGPKKEHRIRQIYQNRIDDEYMLTSLVRFYLIHNLVIDDTDFLIKNLMKYNFAFFYIVAYLTFLSKNSKQRISDKNLVLAVINYDQNSNDEYRSDFIYQTMLEMKSDNIEFANEIMIYLYRQFENFKFFTIYNSYFKIFDCLAMFILDGKLCKEIFHVIQLIFQSENEELYPLSIQLLSLLVQQNFYTSDIQRIFSIETFWTRKELILSLCILGISLYKKKCVDRSILQNLCEFLIEKDPYNAYFLLENLEFTNDDENFTFAMYIAHKNISYDCLLILLSKINLRDARFMMAIDKCLDELLRSVVGKRSINRLKKACQNLKTRTNDEINCKIDALLERNKQREVHFENVLETIIKYFEL